MIIKYESFLMKEINIDEKSLNNQFIGPVLLEYIHIGKALIIKILKIRACILNLPEKNKFR